MIKIRYGEQTCRRDHVNLVNTTSHKQGLTSYHGDFALHGLMNIQKDIVHTAVIETTNAIIKELGDELFAVIIDESRDVSNKEQMVMALRFLTLVVHYKEKIKILRKIVTKKLARKGEDLRSGQGDPLLHPQHFTVSSRGETIKFEGMMVPSRGQAALLTICSCISLASVGLILSIAIPEGGNSLFWLMALSPLAGIYYWKGPSKKEEIKVKMLIYQNEQESDILLVYDDGHVEIYSAEKIQMALGDIISHTIFQKILNTLLRLETSYPSVRTFDLAQNIVYNLSNLFDFKHRTLTFEAVFAFKHRE
ncbi:hypothetical protein AXF42_Ash001020 [Apostasia shenzhenica]|uniref:DUF4371 domain-containing protein n=1 Tax=Apostasia shenzhenica TaxID=1088818 RepID=A0A2I0ATS1_9ASPA|nr:hypothetical protein AXF42_Ash001020 [Apostasia shenzhenica]